MRKGAGDMNANATDAYEQGRRAKFEGKTRTQNPYVAGDKIDFAKQLAWDRGWKELDESASAHTATIQKPE
jgi:hypothetical protein